MSLSNSLIEISGLLMENITTINTTM